MRTAAVLLGVCASLWIDSGQVRYRPTETGPWRPWSFAAVSPEVRQQRRATPADVRAFDQRLQELAAIVRRAPGVSPPVGFAGQLWGSLNSYASDLPGRPAGGAVPLAGALMFGAFPLIEFERGGRMVNEDLKGGETELLQFVVNEIDNSMFGTTRPQGWGSTQLDAFVEPVVGAPVAGHMRIGNVFVVRKNQKPLWLPFSVADALQPVLDDRRTQYEQRRDTYVRQVAEFADWQTPAKRAARRADWQKSAALMPNGAAFVDNMEKTERQIEPEMRARLAPGGREDKTVREAESEFKEVDALVAALSPEARTAPSCYNESATRLSERFRAKDGAPAACRALVRPNWDFFDPKLPRTAPQIVMIAAFTRCLRPASVAEKIRGGCVVNRALVESMDWDAVRAWLDR